MYKKIAALIFSLSSLCAMSAELKNTSDLKPFAESIMKKVAENDIQSAFKLMQPYAVISDAELQSAAMNSKAQREQYGARYGKSFSYEFISQQTIGESLIALVYIEKTEKHALPWTFYFYKNQKGWVLNSFYWNDKLPSLFNTK